MLEEVSFETVSLDDPDCAKYNFLKDSKFKRVDSQPSKISKFKKFFYRLCCLNSSEFPSSNHLLPNQTQT